MRENPYIYIAVMFLVSYAIRVLPLTLIQKQVKSRFLQSFLYYVPYVTLAVMPFTYNISYGIAFGLISYIVISVFCGDLKKIKGSSWVIAALFIAMLVLTH